MAISAYMRRLREKVGHDLVLTPCVAAIVRDGEGRILLQQRSDNGLWSLPAGGIDPGEAPAQAVIREVLEETGLRVRPTRIVGVFGGADGFRYTYPNGDEVEYLCVVFECEVIGGELGGVDDETARLEYFAPGQMPGLAIGYPADLFDSAGERVYYQWAERWLARP